MPNKRQLPISDDEEIEDSSTNDSDFTDDSDSSSYSSSYSSDSSLEYQETFLIRNDPLLNSINRPNTRSSAEKNNPKKPKVGRKPPVPKKKIDIDSRIETLDDLIKLTKTLHPKPDEEYSVDVAKIQALADPLNQLKDMVGLSNIKQSIVEHLLYLLSGLNENQHLMHTVLYGPPGSGKTHLGLILAEVYKALGYSNGKFRIVKRSDLVAGYLGQTTLKTQRAIDSVLGGVLFIDEAYSLGDREQRDSFSKEMIDCLNQNLSEKKSNFICIIAGYREELENCFFASNPGLKRRFPFQYTIHKYSPKELGEIFKIKIVKDGWKLDQKFDFSILEKSFQQNFQYLNHQGGDIENLVQRCKISHSKRIFGRHQVEKRVLTIEDFQAGLESYLSHKKHSKAFKNASKKRRQQSQISSRSDQKMMESLLASSNRKSQRPINREKSQVQNKIMGQETSDIADRFLQQMKKKKII